MAQSLRLAEGDDRLAVGVDRQGGDRAGTLGDRDDLVATGPETDHLAVVESEEQLARGRRLGARP